MEYIIAIVLALLVMAIWTIVIYRVTLPAQKKKLEEVKKAMEDRNVYLAEVKRRQDEYQATKASAVANTSAIGTTAASGAFNF